MRHRCFFPFLKLSYNCSSLCWVYSGMAGSLRFVSNFHKAAFHILKKRQESCIFNAVRHIRTSDALRLREGIQLWSVTNINRRYYHHFVPRPCHLQTGVFNKHKNQRGKEYKQFFFPTNPDNF